MVEPILGLLRHIGIHSSTSEKPIKGETNENEVNDSASYNNSSNDEYGVNASKCFGDT
jgi:hypothetical protein